MVPWVCSRGAQAWCSSEWGGRYSSSSSVVGSPSQARRRHISGVSCAAEAAEDLAADGVVPVAEGAAYRDGIRSPGTAAEHAVAVVTPARAVEHLAVLAIREGTEPGVGLERRRRPLPHVTEQPEHPPWVGAVGIGRDRGRPVVTLAEVGAPFVRLIVAPRVAALRAVGVCRRRELPLGFRRQALARPPGVRLGLVEADVLHGLVVGERTPRAEAQHSREVVGPELRTLEARFGAP